MNKPPYIVPSMREIAEIPHNGFYAVSTFSGCGGSSLGYKMAGYKVLWANEFIPAAQETYRANHVGTILDTRDIRQVRAVDILQAINMQAGDLDLFDGSPPCASFSTAGKREAGWGKIKNYSDTKQRTDDLFFEYTRLIKDIQPKTFVAENVSGLVKGTAKGYFLEILAALKSCGYSVKAKLLDAQWLGVPQMRQRIIFVGVRNDLVAKFGVSPAFPEPLPYNYSVRDALPWITKQATANDVYEDAASAPARTGQDSTGGRASSTLAGEPLGFVEAFIGTYKGSRSIDEPSPSVLTPVRQHTTSELTIERRAYRDKRGAFGNSGDISESPAPAVLAESVGTHWIVESESDISKYAIGDEWDNMPMGDSSERFFSLKRAGTEKPSFAVTAEGGSTSKASVTHPTEKRKFSIAELKRICAFPDDFILTGTYAQQWERLGRAVPPVMMSHIAASIRDGVLCKIK